MRYYNELSKTPVSTFEDIVQLAQAGDKQALRAKKMSEALGRGMHMIVSGLAPSEIVVVGEVTRLWSIVSPIIEDQLRKFPLISIPKIRVTDEPEKARLRSAVALVMSEKAL
jgi:predicted NBD/HSP70 family sugar kinase